MIFLENLNKKYKRKRNNLWKNSPYEFLVTTGLSPDDKGRWGEEFIHSLIEEHTEFNSEWMGDENAGHNDGSIFDININKKRTEVKMATSGVNRKKNKLNYTFQHENIYEEKIWDKLVLLDVEPSGFYLTVINHEDMVFGDNIHPIFKKKSTKHLSAWKFDMSKTSLNRGLENGLTTYLSIDWNESDLSNLKSFLNKHFS
jgi:hypothetical protein